MTKFTYKVTGIETRQAEAELNKLGSEGWEVVGFTEVSASMLRVVLKKVVDSDQQFLVGV